MAFVTHRQPSLPHWLLTSAGLYLAALCGVFVVDSGDPAPPALEFLIPSIAAGAFIARLWAPALPLAFLLLIEPFLPVGWSGDVAEDSAAAAMILGVVAGVAVRRGWDYGRPRRPAHGFVEAPAHRWKVVTDLARRLVNRRAIDSAIDLLRLRLDVFPRGLYQPVATLPLRAATRGRGSASRWEAIAPVLDELDVRDAVDIGSNVGYFPLQLGSAGIRTLGIEGDPPIFRTGLLAVRRSGLKNIGAISLELDPGNVDMVPPADAVLCLSVWHHFVREFGLEDADRMLATIWERSRKVLFFDSGENEMPASFGLPDMGDDPRGWLARHLGATCRGGRAEYLGRHEAFDATGNRCQRSLFGVIRAEPGVVLDTGGEQAADHNKE
jgi:hypothetical protein